MMRILYHWTKDIGSFRLLHHQHTRSHVLASVSWRVHTYAQCSLGSSLHNTALENQCLRQIIARLWFAVTCWWRRSQNEPKSFVLMIHIRIILVGHLRLIFRVILVSLQFTVQEKVLRAPSVSFSSLLSVRKREIWKNSWRVQPLFVQPVEGQKIWDDFVKSCVMPASHVHVQLVLPNLEG